MRAKKRVTAFIMGVVIALCAPADIFAVTGESRVIADPSNVEIVDVSQKPEEEENTATVQVYTDIEVSTSEDMILLSQMCRLDTWSVDKRVILKNDISLYDTGFVTIPTFGGYFEGRGHTIRGITAKKGTSFVGLFNITQPTAVISDLNVEGVLTPGDSSMVIGGIVGDNYGVIQNCSFAGTIKGKDYIGGVAGFNEAGASIVSCESFGKISGVHYTGGICGENAGGIAECINSADVNITVDDSSTSINDLSIDSYRQSFFSIVKGNENTKRENTTVVNGSIDSGGIAGLSLGAISGCTNKGIIGYEHVGYNTGGIAGRSSGYIYNCVNEGRIFGRKDIGGIAGQAEPYVQLDLTEDIISQITVNVNDLHDLIDTTLKDAGAASDTITMRLNMVKSFADKALDDTHFLAMRAEDVVDGVMSSANEAMSRIDFIMSELDKEGGVFDSLSASASDTKKTVQQLVKAVDDADLSKYMTESDRDDYEYAREQIQKAPEDYDAAKQKVEKPYEYMFLDKELNEEDSSFKQSLNNADPPIEYPSEVLSDVFPYDENGNRMQWPGDYPFGEAFDYYKGDVSQYENIAGVGHFDGNRLISDFPDDYDRKTAWYTCLKDAIRSDRLDYELRTVSSDAPEGEIKKRVDDEYMNNYNGNDRRNHGDGGDYAEQMAFYTKTLADLVDMYSDELQDQERKDLKKVAGYVRDTSSDLEAAGGGAREIVSNLNGRSKITLPTLGDDFHVRTSSLNSNMQGISDNLGYLNQELAGNTDVLIDDLGAVNDQFNKMMLLITDAIDGALDMDYTTTYEDSSDDVAETCIDGTVADCVNNARVEGDLDVSGITGTMAIEYEFDVESDITGIKSDGLNSTYLTKCVLRNNINNGYVRSEKSCCGGITGLQEMGTVLGCENYGNIVSKSGDYVGGIAGQSLSTIKRCAANSIESGQAYIGGIAGKGDDIFDCFSIPNITNAAECFGAIAGDVEENGIIKNNFFCSQELSGIDRISYSGKAEPVDYADLLRMDGVPEGFDHFTVSFIVNDEEAGRIRVKYGDTLRLEDYPELELSEGCYAKWETDIIRDIYSNVEISAEECRFLTTLAGDALRENGQSVLLVDGRFKDGDELDINKVMSVALPMKNVSEHYSVTIPKDGELSHLVRYQPQNMEDDIAVYIKVGNDWRKTDTQEFGLYRTFESSGNQVELVITETQTTDKKYIIIAAAAGTILILIILFIVIRGIRKRARVRKNRKKQTKDPDSKTSDKKKPDEKKPDEKGGEAQTQ